MLVLLIPGLKPGVIQIKLFQSFVSNNILVVYCFCLQPEFKAESIQITLLQKFLYSLLP